MFTLKNYLLLLGCNMACIGLRNAILHTEVQDYYDIYEIIGITMMKIVKYTHILCLLEYFQTSMLNAEFQFLFDILSHMIQKRGEKKICHDYAIIIKL